MTAFVHHVRADTGRPPVALRGFTLAELLVASTLALITMAALASLFATFSRGISNSQQLVQLTDRMRSATSLLRQDLQGATTNVSAFIRPEAAAGYFELVEGPMSDTGAATVTDVDDILMLTTASLGRPFTGLLSGTITTTTGTAIATVGSFESPAAEVVWFCKAASQLTNGMQLFNLYRRQLLVAGTPGAGAMMTSGTVPVITTAVPTQTGTTPLAQWDLFFQFNDMSVRREGNSPGTFLANSLADLSRRQSRFMHNITGTANPAVRATWPRITTAAVSAVPSGSTEVLTSVREGEDLLLSNVVAFDVRVFDPQQASGGAYVDLGSGGATILTGSGAAIPFTGMTAGSAVYDTWSLHTEANNLQDNPPAGVDRGTNLGDDVGSSGAYNGVVDDADELEQPPPYNVPLRGLEIRIRCYEPSSQQTRQVTVQHSFLVR